MSDKLNAPRLPPHAQPQQPPMKPHTFKDNPSAHAGHNLWLAEQARLEAKRQERKKNGTTPHKLTPEETSQDDN